MRRDQRADQRWLDQQRDVDPIQFAIDRRVCEGKARFTSKQNARNKLKRTQRERGTGHIYACNVCGAWHITSMTREFARSTRRAR